MAPGNLSNFLRLVRCNEAAHRLGEKTDRELVEQFLTGRDEGAFAAILARHGPMVSRVCSLTLRHEQDAEDAFQATFLLLARKAHSVRRLDSLAAWLHGVAHRVSLKARAQAATRRQREAAALPPDAPQGDNAELHAQLERLPEKWRLPLILCFLEGRTQDEAAGQLGWSKMTLRRRLAEGREALARRLGGLPETIAPAAPPPVRLLYPITTAATKLAASEAVPDGLLSAGAVALSEGVSIPMTWTKTKMLLALLALAAACSGVGLASGLLTDEKETAKEKPKPKDVEKKLTKEEAALKEFKGKWKVTGFEADGRQADEAELKGMIWTFDGNAMAGNRQFVANKGTITLRPEKEPKEIDLLSLDGPEKGKTLKGIYKIEKGVLTIGLRKSIAANKDRPKDFKTENGSGLGVITLEREKKKD